MVPPVVSSPVHRAEVLSSESTSLDYPIVAADFSVKPPVTHVYTRRVRPSAVPSSSDVPSSSAVPSSPIEASLSEDSSP